MDQPAAVALRLGRVAGSAQGLEAVRKVVRDKPAVHFQGGPGADLGAMRRPASVHMVDAEPVRASAASALTAVATKDQVLVAPVASTPVLPLAGQAGLLAAPGLVRMLKSPAPLTLSLPLAFSLKIGLPVAAALLAVAFTAVSGQAVFARPVHAELGNWLVQVAGAALAQFHAVMVAAPWHFWLAG